MASKLFPKHTQHLVTLSTLLQYNRCCVFQVTLRGNWNNLLDVLDLILYKTLEVHKAFAHNINALIICYIKCNVYKILNNCMKLEPWTMTEFALLVNCPFKKTCCWELESTSQGQFPSTNYCSIFPKSPQICNMQWHGWLSMVYVCPFMCLQYNLYVYIPWGTSKCEGSTVQWAHLY